MASIRRTPGLLLISLFLGISLWVFVTDTENPTVVESFPQPIPVEAVNVGTTLAVANQLPSVTVRIAAPTDRWEQLSAANFRVLVDLSGFDARAQEVPLQVEVSGVSGVRVVDTDPRTIVVNLEDLVSKTVPVMTRVIGSLPIGYELTGMAPVQSEVMVTGPESLVAEVSEAVADVPVTGLTVGVDQTVTLRPLGAGGSEIRGVRVDPTAVRVSLGITQRTIVRTVPLTVAVVGNPAPGFRVTGVSTSPPAVQVQGPIEALQQVDSIALPAVNVNASRTDIVRSVAIPLPPGLSFVDTERATVTVTVSAISSVLRTSTVIQVENLSSGLEASLDAPNVTLDIEGPLPVLNALVAGEIQASVNLAGLTVGTHSVAIHVALPEGVQALTMQPTTATVTITSP